MTEKMNRSANYQWGGQGGGLGYSYGNQGLHGNTNAFRSCQENGNQAFYGNTNAFPSSQETSGNDNSWDTFQDPGRDFDKVSAQVKVQEEQSHEEIVEPASKEWAPAMSPAVATQQETKVDQNTWAPAPSDQSMSIGQQSQGNANNNELSATKITPAAPVSGSESNSRQNAWDAAINNVIASHEQKRGLRQDPDVARVRESFGASSLNAERSTQQRSPVTMREVVDAQIGSKHVPINQTEPGFITTQPQHTWSQDVQNAQDQWNYPSANADSKNKLQEISCSWETPDFATLKDTKFTQNRWISTPNYAVKQDPFTASQNTWTDAPATKGPHDDQPFWNNNPTNVVATEPSSQPAWDAPNHTTKKAGSESSWDVPSTNTVKTSTAATNDWVIATAGDAPLQEQEGIGSGALWDEPEEAQESWAGNQPHQERGAYQARFDETPRRSGFGFAPHGSNSGGRYQEERAPNSSYGRRKYGNPNENNRFSAFGTGDARRYSNNEADGSAPQTAFRNNSPNYPVRIDMPQGRDRQPWSSSQNIRSSPQHAQATLVQRQNEFSPQIRQPSNFGQSFRSPQQHIPLSSTQRKKEFKPPVHQAQEKERQPSNFGQGVRSPQQYVQIGSDQRQSEHSLQMHQPQANSKFFQNAPGVEQGSNLPSFAQSVRSSQLQQARASHVQSSPVQHAAPSPPFFSTMHDTQALPVRATSVSKHMTRDATPTPQHHLQSNDGEESPDWMITDNGHHYVRSIFHFTPRTYLLPPPTARPLTVASHPIAGIGTVHLLVRRSPLDREVHTLVLKNVLHIPSAPCNGFDPGLLGQQCTELDGVVQGTGSRGREVWFAELWCGSPRLVVQNKGTGGNGGNGEVRSLLEGKGGWWCGSMYPSGEEVKVLEEWMGLLAK